MTIISWEFSFEHDPEQSVATVEASCPHQAEAIMAATRVLHAGAEMLDDSGHDSTELFKAVASICATHIATQERRKEAT